MFYKKGYLSKEEKQLFLDHSFELACALKDVFEQSLQFKNTDFKLLEILNEKENKPYFALQIKNELFNPISLSFNNTNNRFFNRSNQITKSTKKLDDNINQEAYQKIKRIIGDDFFKVAKLPNFKANDGKTYKAEYISNYDPNILSFVIGDVINILDQQNNQLGYLKVKYTTPKILEELEKLNILEEREKQFADLFSNAATIDYVKFKSNDFGDYSKKGLATYAYLEMAKELNKKGISLRSSVLQSDNALNFWDRLKENFPDFVKELTIDSDTVYILQPPENYQFKIKSKPRKRKP